MNPQVRTSLLEFECAMDEVADMLEILTEENDEVMLWGAPGIGKSSVVFQLGQRKRPQGHRVSDRHSRAR